MENIVKLEEAFAQCSISEKHYKIPAILDNNSSSTSDSNSRCMPVKKGHGSRVVCDSIKTEKKS